jgi:AmmeMemoRadiSam system protein A
MSIDPLGQALLLIARNAIAAHFGQESSPVTKQAPHPALAQPGASFVTLTQKEKLRGCIGSLEAYRPLSTDVAENAVAAAFRDPRFPPLASDELARTRIEVSLLAAPQAIVFSDEADAIARLRPGIDGLILTHGHRRATFLPQVWDALPDSWQFVAELKQKAGLPADFWDDEIRLSRYEVKKWKEN